MDTDGKVTKRKIFRLVVGVTQAHLDNQAADSMKLATVLLAL